MAMTINSTASHRQDQQGFEQAGQSGERCCLHALCCVATRSSISSRRRWLRLRSCAPSVAETVCSCRAHATVGRLRAPCAVFHPGHAAWQVRTTPAPACKAFKQRHAAADQDGQGVAKRAALMLRIRRPPPDAQQEGMQLKRRSGLRQRTLRQPTAAEMPATIDAGLGG